MQTRSPAIIRQTAAAPIRAPSSRILSANLDFSGDPNLNPLFTSAIQDAENYTGFPPAAGIGKKIAPATILNENGEKIGVVGATTPDRRRASPRPAAST